MPTKPRRPGLRARRQIIAPTLRKAARNLYQDSRELESEGKNVRAAVKRGASKVVGTAANIADPDRTPTGKRKERRFGTPKAAAGAKVYKDGGSLPIPGRRAAAGLLRKLADKKVKKAIKLKGKGRDVRAMGKMDRAKQLRSTASNLERKARQNAPRRRRLSGRR